MLDVTIQFLLRTSNYGNLNYIDTLKYNAGLGRRCQQRQQEPSPIK